GEPAPGERTKSAIQRPAPSCRANPRRMLMARSDSPSENASAQNGPSVPQMRTDQWACVRCVTANPGTSPGAKGRKSVRCSMADMPSRYCNAHSARPREERRTRLRRQPESRETVTRAGVRPRPSARDFTLVGGDHGRPQKRRFRADMLTSARCEIGLALRVFEEEP